MRSHRTKVGLEIHKWLLHAEDWSQLITGTQKDWDKAGEVVETGDVPITFTIRTGIRTGFAWEVLYSRV
jgi:hypothetical protein